MSAALWPDLSMDTIIRRARILVIDDGEFAYKDLFKKSGFNIDKWNDVQRLQDLEAGEYDLILLDLHGIGRKLSNDQGLGVLQHLKQANPDQVVIAYSNAEWGLKYQPFFDLADAVLPKSADYLDFKRVVEEQLHDYFNVNAYTSRLESALMTSGFGRRQAIRIVKQLTATEDLTATRTLISKKIKDQVTLDNLLALANTVIKVVQLWRG